MRCESSREFMHKWIVEHCECLRGDIRSITTSNGGGWNWRVKGLHEGVEKVAAHFEIHTAATRAIKWS